jgi:hypothetical protein
VDHGLWEPSQTNAVARPWHRSISAVWLRVVSRAVSLIECRLDVGGRDLQWRQKLGDHGWQGERDRKNGTECASIETRWGEHLFLVILFRKLRFALRYMHCMLCIMPRTHATHLRIAVIDSRTHTQVFANEFSIGVKLKTILCSCSHKKANFTFES